MNRVTDNLKSVHGFKIGQRVIWESGYGPVPAEILKPNKTAGIYIEVKNDSPKPVRLNVDIEDLYPVPEFIRKERMKLDTAHANLSALAKTYIESGGSF